jgi:hypothetical protein
MDLVFKPVFFRGECSFKNEVEPKCLVRVLVLSFITCVVVGDLTDLSKPHCLNYKMELVIILAL